MKKFHVLSVIAVLFAGLGLLTSGAQAASYTWNTTSDGNWSVRNWTPEGATQQRRHSPWTTTLELMSPYPEQRLCGQ